MKTIRIAAAWLALACTAAVAQPPSAAGAPFSIELRSDTASGSQLLHHWSGTVPLDGTEVAVREVDQVTYTQGFQTLCDNQREARIYHCYNHPIQKVGAEGFEAQVAARPQGGSVAFSGALTVLRVHLDGPNSRQEQTKVNFLPFTAQTGMVVIELPDGRRAYLITQAAGP